MNIKKLESCRLCGERNLSRILDLGQQELTGVFPKSKEDKLTSGPLELLFCPKCGLLQLGHSYDLNEMYGDNYGYRSGLNRSMVNHLSAKANMIESRYNVTTGDVVLDIGSNDGTLLNAYKTSGIHRIGMDPTGRKFKQYYDKNVDLIPEFFSAKSFEAICDKKAKIVTTVSMFYDLEDPVDFAWQVESVLEDDGMWHLEQSYMPTMLRSNAYDTICHEHLEYYSLGVLMEVMEEADLRIINVSTNDVNGGSFTADAVKKGSGFDANDVLIEWFLLQERKQELMTEKPYIGFAERVADHRNQFTSLLDSLSSAGKLVCGYGASTKGNVLLQYCGITPEQIKVIGEVNPDKFGSFTPGTLIPIEDETAVKAMNPDYLVVFPWHFRNGIVAKETEFLKRGGRFIFPLPHIEIV